MSRPLVFVAVPVAGMQAPAWWQPFTTNLLRWSQQYDVWPAFGQGAMPDHSKNGLLRNLVGGNAGLTSYNRNDLAAQARAGGAEWILWIDHDTVPPPDALPRLMALQRPFVAGAYYHRNSPHAPLAYRRVEHGLYRPIADFEKGALLEVDAVGMGCTLMHVEILEAIRAQYVQFWRGNGTRFLVHQDDVRKGRLIADGPQVLQAGDALTYVEPVRRVSEAEARERDYPYFDMEHGRTEDIGFCERAQRAGYTIYVDTSIECEHWHYEPIEGDRFREARLLWKVQEPGKENIDPEGLA